MASLSGWTEAIIFSLLFVGVLGIVTIEFNSMYDENNEIPFTDQSGAAAKLESYMSTSSEQVAGGEVEFDAQNGITLKSSWGLITSLTSIIWSFISAGWIEDIINAWNLGEAGTKLANFIRIMYFISLVLAIFYGLFKVVT